MRYVGKTVNLKARLHRHCADYDRGKVTHCSTWVKGLLNDGLEPMMEVLEECNEETWREAERDWIAKARNFGLDLTNMVDGGNGGHARGVSLSEETKKKISQKLKGRVITWAKPLTPEDKARLLASRGNNKTRLGMKNSPEHNAKIGRANSIALKGRKVSEDERERLRQMVIKRWANRDKQTE